MIFTLAEGTSGLKWFKSSFCESDSNDCVEVAAADRTIHVRDSKNVHGPQLTVGAGAWTDFIAYATEG